MARTAGDAALDFEMKMLLDTKEAEASAARLESALGGVLKVFGALGKAATGTVGLITAAIKAPADLDNYLGSLNTKITNVNGALFRYRDTLLRMQASHHAPGSALFGFSPEDYQKTMMGFARGASEGEKYGATMSRNISGYAQGVGQISKGVGTSVEETTGIVSSFHRELGISYTNMDKFGKQLANIGRQSGMTADQTKVLYRTVTSLGRSYGLSGNAAQKFVENSVAVGAAITKIGLDAQQVIRQMNEVATGSEEGLIQSLLLGFKPSDPAGQLKAFQDQAKMITQMAGQAGEQFAPFMIRKLGDKLGMKNFSVEQIQAMSRGESMEGPDGEVTQRDVVEVLKGIQQSLDNPRKAAEGPYATMGQTIQEAFTKFITFLQMQFTPAMMQLKDVIQQWIPRIIGTLDKWMSLVEGWIKKIQDFFHMGKSPLETLALGSAIAALIPTVLPLIISYMVRAGFGAAASLFGRGAATGAATGAAAGGLGALGISATTAVSAAGLTAIAATVITGLAVGGVIGHIIDKYLWTGAGKDKFFDNVVSFFQGKSMDKQGKIEAEKDKVISDLRGGKIPQGQGVSVSPAAAEEKARIDTLTKLGYGTLEQRIDRSAELRAKNFTLDPTISKMLTPEERGQVLKDWDWRDAIEAKKKNAASPPKNVRLQSDIPAVVAPPPPKEEMPTTSSWFAKFQGMGMDGNSPMMGGQPVTGIKYSNEINEAASQHGINPAILGALVQRESNFNPNAIGGSGEVGLAQILPSTAEGLEKGSSGNLKDPKTNLRLSAKYLAQMSKKYGGDTEKTLAAYNTGPGNLDHAIKEAESKGGNWIDYVDPRTKNYVSGVMQNSGQNSLANLAPGSELTVKDTESHNLLREIANKLGITTASNASNTTVDQGTPRTDANVAALTPLHLDQSMWNGMMLRNTRGMATGFNDGFA